ncbi:MAG: methyltransferase domain-containing protein [Deltaproteobacteria bacterium]|nr:methyltransferase domain-containing protein [Deltaproteobacteria bacterium]
MKRRTSYQDVPWYRYDALLVRAVRDFVRQALDGVLVRPGLRVLDVGCGEQPLRASVEARGARYLGVDVSANPAHTTAALCRADALPFAAASFDVVLLTEVLEHVDEPATAIGECARVLRPGGSLIVTVPFMYPLHEEPHDFLRPTAHLLRRLCDEQGLEVVDLSPLGDTLGAAATLLDHAWSTTRGPAHWARLGVRMLSFGLVTAARAAGIGGRSAPVGHGLLARRR